jgi:glycine dehydrogenase subunit 1
MSYVQSTDSDRKAMLEAVGAETMEDLLEPVERSLRIEGGLDLGEPLSEPETAAALEALSRKNCPASDLASFLGGGVYDRYIPAIVRYVLSRSEFYTSYTPYQAEVSQGTLQAIYEYQSLICRLTGMEVANASMYDGATALAEAVLMAHGIKRGGSVLVPRALSPRIKSVLRSYTKGRAIEIGEIPFDESGGMNRAALGDLVQEGTAAVVLAQPNYLGVIENAAEIVALAHDRKALVIAYVDPFSLALLSPPGEYDADIVAGEGQSLGNAMNFGGPLLGFMATKKAFMRRMPGRLISGSKDVDGKRGYVMTLQTREQHIRREKATSNICTNEGLCALAAAAYISALGEDGFREVAVQSMSKSHALYRMLKEAEGCELPFGEDFFQEFVLRLHSPIKPFLEKAKAKGILAGIPLSEDFPELGPGALLVAVTEKRSRADLESYAEIVKGGA